MTSTALRMRFVERLHAFTSPHSVKIVPTISNVLPASAGEDVERDEVGRLGCTHGCQRGTAAVYRLGTYLARPSADIPKAARDLQRCWWSRLGSNAATR